MTVLDSLLVSLGYDFDDGDLSEFESSLESVNAGIRNASLAAVGFITAFAGAEVASARATDELTKQARELNIAVGVLDAYNFAGEQTIGTSSGIAAGLRQLAMRAAEAARGTGSAIEAFGMLGISTTDAHGRLKPIPALLGEAADALNALDDNGRRLELADKLGIGSLDLLLRQGSDGISQLVREANALGVVVEKDGAVAEEFNDQLNRMQRVVTSLWREISTELLPFITATGESMQEWVMQNKEILRSRITVFIKGVGMVMRNLRTIMLSLLALKFATFILGLVVAYKKLGAAALIANLKMAAIVVAIAAVIAIIGLLIEDFIVFRRGGESAIGALLEKFPLLDALFTKIGADVAQVVGWIKTLMGVVGALMDVARAALTDFFEWFANILTKAQLKTTDAFTAIGAGIDIIKNAFQKAQDATDAFFNKLKGAFNELRNNFSMLKRLIPGTISTRVEVDGEISDGLNGVLRGPLARFRNDPLVQGLSQSGDGQIPAPGGKAPIYPVIPPDVSFRTPREKSRGANVTNNRNTINLNINGNDTAKMEKVVKDVISGEIEQASKNAQSPSEI